MHIFQKLGVIISASMRDSKVVNRGDFVVAKKLLESMEHHLPYVLQKITGTETSDIHDEIINFIRKRKVLTQAQIIAKFMRKIDKRTLDAVIEALVESQVVRAEGDILNPTITYIRRK
jgi:citrate lyase gamma subunit